MTSNCHVLHKCCIITPGKALLAQSAMQHLHGACTETRGLQTFMLCKDLSHSLYASLCNRSHWQDLKGLLYLYANVLSTQKQKGDDGCYKRRCPAIGAPGRKWEPEQPPDEKSGSVPASGQHISHLKTETKADTRANRHAHRSNPLISCFSAETQAYKMHTDAHALA